MIFSITYNNVRAFVAWVNEQKQLKIISISYFLPINCCFTVHLTFFHVHITFYANIYVYFLIKSANFSHVREMLIFCPTFTRVRLPK